MRMEIVHYCQKLSTVNECKMDSVNFTYTYDYSEVEKITGRKNVSKPAVLRAHFT